MTAEDGVASATYEITVSKDVAASSSDLSSLILDGIDLTPAFDSGTEMHTLRLRLPTLPPPK